MSDVKRIEVGPVVYRIEWQRAPGTLSDVFETTDKAQFEKKYAHLYGLYVEGKIAELKISIPA